jgi:hypothetical protein
MQKNFFPRKKSFNFRKMKNESRIDFRSKVFFFEHFIYHSPSKFHSLQPLPEKINKSFVGWLHARSDLIESVSICPRCCCWALCRRCLVKIWEVRSHMDLSHIHMRSLRRNYNLPSKIDDFSLAVDILNENRGSYTYCLWFNIGKHRQITN